MRTKAMVPGLLIAGLLAASAPGCGATGGRADGESVLEQGPVEQVGRMLRVYQKGLKPPTTGAKDLPVYKPGPVPPPRRAEDIRPMARGFPKAFNAIRDREVLLYWNTDLSDSADAASTVLAFARDVPEGGGQVLMRDDSTRRMTASEFAAARKPEGAKTDDEKPAPSKR